VASKAWRGLSITLLAWERSPSVVVWVAGETRFGLSVTLLTWKRSPAVVIWVTSESGVTLLAWKGAPAVVVWVAGKLSIALLTRERTPAVVVWVTSELSIALLTREGPPSVVIWVASELSVTLLTRERTPSVVVWVTSELGLSLGLRGSDALLDGLGGDDGSLGSERDSAGNSGVGQDGRSKNGSDLHAVDGKCVVEDVFGKKSRTGEGTKVSWYLRSDCVEESVVAVESDLYRPAIDSSIVHE